MAAASYDQLLKQVEALKMENSNLRQELEDNSNHLTKLETEASNMKEVLKQLQGSIEDEAMASSGQIDLLERLKELNLDSSNFPGVKLRSKMSLRSYGSREGSVSSRSGECSPVPMGSFPRRGFVNGSRENTGYLEELEKERSLLLADLDKEEKEKDWYYAQLQNLTKRIDSLPLTENFSLQTDMTRRQLEYEARQIRVAMEEQLGTCQDMEKRAQVPCRPCYAQSPSPAAGHHRSTPPLETPGHSRASLGQSPFSLVLVHTRFCLFPPGVLFPQSYVSSGCSVVGLTAASSKRAYAIPQSAAPRASASEAGHC